MATRKYSPAQLRKFRSGVARLKRKGLVSKKVDARSVQPTSHMVAQVKRFQDVADRRATVLTAKDKAQASALSGAFRVKGKKVVVSKDHAEKPRLSKKTGVITETREMYGRKVKRRITPESPQYLDKVRNVKAPRGTVLVYAVPFGSGKHSHTLRWTDYEEMVNFMQSYEFKSRNPYAEWRKYVIVEEVSRKELSMMDIEDEEDEE